MEGQTYFFDGQTITYDQIGNPLTYREGMSFAWQNGKELAQVGVSVSESYTYDDTGLRISKNTNNGTIKYYYNGDNLVEQEGTDASIHFFYDNDNNIVGFNTNDSVYYYVKNIQNDVTEILDKDGNLVVSYAYDTWGKPLSTTGEIASTIGVKIHCVTVVTTTILKQNHQEKNLRLGQQFWQQFQEQLAVDLPPQALGFWGKWR